MSLLKAADDLYRPCYFHKNVACVESVEFGEFLLIRNFIEKSHFVSFYLSSFAGKGWYDNAHLVGIMARFLASS